MFMRTLKHNLQFLKDFEIIIVDDGSDKEVRRLIRDSGIGGDKTGANTGANTATATDANIKVITNKKNLGFAPTMNIGCKGAKGELLILLGSDVRFKKGLPTNLTERFKEDLELFAISFKQEEKDGSLVGKNHVIFENGFPAHFKTDNVNRGENAFADGGSSIVRKKYFDKLGGFNELYAPFYWEDVDLSYRAYSRGWKIEFEPEIFVEHHHGATRVLWRKYRDTLLVR